MAHERSTGWIPKLVGLGATLAFAGVVIGACNGPPGGGAGEELGVARSAAFTNGGFETGAANMVPGAPWVLTDFVNVNGVPKAATGTPTYTDLGLVAHGAACTKTNQCTGANPEQGSTCSGGVCSPISKTIILNSPTGPGTQSDMTLGATAAFRWPRYGNQCAIVNQLGNDVNVNQLTQTMTVGPADVDPADNKVHIRAVVAPILEDPGHPANQQPYFFVQVTNVTQGNAVLYSNYNFSNQNGVPWQVVVNTSTYRYTDWQLIDVAPGSPAINMGDQIELTLIAAGCSLGAHMGELYVDGVGSTVPGLYVSGTGPAQANPGTSITYNLSYNDGQPSVACSATAPCAGTGVCTGGVCAETGVVIDYTAPPGTTIQSFTSPPGATCVQVAQTITCTFAGAVTPGQTGNFSVTVAVGAPTTCTTSAMCPLNINCVNGFCDESPLNCGDYGIKSNQESHLLGNKISTILGCTQDTDCPAGNWCDESKDLCTPTLANGTPIPTDMPHTNPTLNGTCAAAGAGALVCTSKVCDTDNDCGYANSDGPCTPGATGNGAVVCRSTVCDTDGKCGYANGDGPCTVASGPSVCRSGLCSNNGLCIATGTCNVDADCTGGKWCDESTHTCTAQLANGTPIPSDPPHTNPTLDGTCNPGAGMLVCVSGVCDMADSECGYANSDGPCTVANGGTTCRSGVCDTDNLCGYKDGDGPCTMANGMTVCRSGMCSPGGVCEPSGGCNVDSDCASGNWCNESTHTCSPTVANGMMVPSDPAHTSPTLDGTCSVAAGTLTCTSGVCDTDNLCGYKDGDGPCTTANGASVCRSGMCSTSGVCEPKGGCNVDSDCASGNWCNETTHTCSPTVANGMMVPSDPAHTNPTLNGTCTAAAGALTCSSGVCDTDNLCGYKNGDGPCTQSNGDAVCRSGQCGSNGTCVGCTMDSQCAAPTPVCNTSSGNCVQCTMSSQCTNASMAICDMTSFTCAPCNGDNGSGASAACPTAGLPFCFLSGANQGTCGKCSTDSDCTGHTGNICNTLTGLCVAGCDSDSQCISTQWCNNSPGGIGQCVPKLPNGQMLPSSPSDVATCNAMVGTRVCVSGVCDTKDNTCGYANGDGPCSSNGQCRDNTCDSMTMTCMMSSSSSASSSSGSPGNCVTDADCTAGDFCQNSSCVPKLGVGQACTRPTQCQSADCTGNVCSDTIGSGNGVICSASPGRSSSSGGTAGLFGLMLAAAGFARRRSSSRK